jgi:L-asparaginase II
MDLLHLDAKVSRGRIVESHHRVHAAVVDASGRLIASAREPTL